MGQNGVGFLMLLLLVSQDGHQCSKTANHYRNSKKLNFKKSITQSSMRSPDTEMTDLRFYHSIGEDIQYPLPLTGSAFAAPSAASGRGAAQTASVSAYGDGGRNGNAVNDRIIYPVGLSGTFDESVRLANNSSPRHMKKVPTASITNESLQEGRSPLCRTRICLNDGKCTRQAVGTLRVPVCLCPPAWRGAHCQKPHDPCLTGTASCAPFSCTRDPGHLTAGFTCNCDRASGWSAKSAYDPRCVRTQLDCHTQPCQNGARCLKQPGGGSKCTCTGNTFGQRCELYNTPSYAKPGDHSQNVPVSSMSKQPGEFNDIHDNPAPRPVNPQAQTDMRLATNEAQEMLQPSGANFIERGAHRNYEQPSTHHNSQPPLPIHRAGQSNTPAEPYPLFGEVNGHQNTPPSQNSFVNQQKLTSLPGQWTYLQQSGPQLAIDHTQAQSRAQHHQTAPELSYSLPQTPHQTAPELSYSLPQTPHETAPELSYSLPQTHHQTAPELSYSLPQTPHQTAPELSYSLPQTPHQTAPELSYSLPQTSHQTAPELSYSLPQTSHNRVPSDSTKNSVNEFVVKKAETPFQDMNQQGLQSQKSAGLFEGVRSRTNIQPPKRHQRQLDRNSIEFGHVGNRMSSSLFRRLLQEVDPILTEAARHLIIEINE